MSTERIKALEVQQVNDSEKLDKILIEQEAQGRDIEDIKLSMGKQRGYIAGAMSVIVVIWTVALAVGAAIWDSLTDLVP